MGRSSHPRVFGNNSTAWILKVMNAGQKILQLLHEFKLWSQPGQTLTWSSCIANLGNFRSVKHST